jgi:hypothetical protein
MQLPFFAHSVRAPARFAMPGILALSVAGALAFNRLKLYVVPRRILAAVLMAGIIADGWVGHLPLLAQPDTWRAPKDSRYGAVLELPLGEGAQDFLAMYRTTQDGHSTVNGHSGYFPLHYLALQLALSEKDSSVFDAVTPREEPLLVVLDKHADGDGRWNALITSAPRAVPVASDDHWAFFSISPSQGGTPCVGKELDIASATDGHHSVDVAAWKDHDPKTVWISRKPQHAGDAIFIDLGREAAVCGIRMSIADSWFVYPRGLTVATSADGHSWAPAFTGSTAALAIRGILDNPKDIWLDVPLRLTAAARYIRLQLHVSHKSYPWFIPDLQVVGPQ